MKTLADVKRRAVPGARLEVLTQTKRPVLVGTIRTITVASGRLYGFTSSDDDSGYVYRTEWPKAAQVRIIDTDTFEYDLPYPASTRDRTHVIRLRFLPPEETAR